MGVEIDPKVVESLNKPLREEVAKIRREAIICPYCGSADIQEFIPPKGEVLTLARMKLKPNGTVSDPVGGYAVKVYVCLNCKGITLKQD